MDINKFFILFLKVIFFFAAKLKTELCYDPDDCEIYQVTKRGETGCTLLPLHGADAPIVDFNPDKLIFCNNLSERSEIIGNFIGFDNIEKIENQPKGQFSNKTPTVLNENTGRAKTDRLTLQKEKERDFIGIGKVDLPRFSILYTGETAKVSELIENLLDKVFSATNKQQTIEKSIEDYNAAKKYAKSGQIYELKQLAERLQGRINKQTAIQNAKDTMAAQQAARKKMIFSSVAVVVIALLYFGITHFNQNMPSVQAETEITVTSTPLSELDKAIIEWEHSTGKKIYPAGRKCLEKKCKGMNKDQIIRVINQNIK